MRPCTVHVSWKITSTHFVHTVAGLKVRVSPSLLHVSISLRVHHHIFYSPPLSYSLILAALDTHQLFHPNPQLHWESARTAPLQWQLHGSISVWSEGHCSRKQTKTKPQEADRCKYLMSLIACVLLLVSNCSRCYWLQSTLYWTQYRTHSTTHKHLVVVCMYKKCCKWPFGG